MRPILLSVDGSIGAGKSTLLEALRVACPNIAMVKEPVDTWMTMKDADGRNILELFYDNIDRYAYTFQHTTLMTRIANTREAMAAHAGTDTVLISERSILTDRYVFATMLREQGKLSPIEWDLYLRWYNLLTEYMPVSGVIYLTTGVDTCVERIKRRNRPGEHVPRDYLVDLDKAHKEWINDTDLPVLRVSTEDGEDRDALIEQIRTFVDRLKTEMAAKVEAEAARASTPVSAVAAAAGGSPGDKLAVPAPVKPVVELAEGVEPKALAFTA